MAAASGAAGTAQMQGRRRKTAAERRLQAARADARRLLWACKALASLQTHRGGELGRFGTALQTAFQTVLTAPGCTQPGESADTGRPVAEHHGAAQPEGVPPAVELEVLELLGADTRPPDFFWHTLGTTPSEVALPKDPVVPPSLGIPPADVITCLAPKDDLGVLATRRRGKVPKRCGASGAAGTQAEFLPGEPTGSAPSGGAEVGAISSLKPAKKSKRIDYTRSSRFEEYEAALIKLGTRGRWEAEIHFLKQVLSSWRSSATAVAEAPT